MRHCCVQIVIQFHVRWHLSVCLKHPSFRFLSKAMNAFGFLCRLCVLLDHVAPALCCALLSWTLHGIVDVQCGRMKCLSVRPPHAVCTVMAAIACTFYRQCESRSEPTWSSCSLCRPHALLVLKFATSTAQRLIAWPVRSLCGYVRAALPCRGGFAIK